jgi:hypothetical protein
VDEGQGIVSELFPEVKSYTIEDLNPNSRAVKDIEMTVRRGLALAKLCRVHLDLHEGDVSKAVACDPREWGSMPKKKGKKYSHNPHTLLSETFASVHDPMLRKHWKVLFFTWYSGGLDSQIRAAINCLPNAVANKYRKEQVVEPE